MPDEEEEIKMSRSAIGQKGGTSTRDTMLAKDPDFYSRIGRIGGQARAQDLDMRNGELARKGGEACKASHGPEYYSTIGKIGGQSRANAEDVRSGKVGRKGGEATKAKMRKANPNFYAEIGGKGGRALRAPRPKRKKSPSVDGADLGDEGDDLDEKVERLTDQAVAIFGGTVVD